MSNKKGVRGTRTIYDLESRAHTLAERLPNLLVEARRAAHTVVHGIHGRRRSGPGETFWQFRPYEYTDPASAIDWRRSATSDHVYIRQREWEAAHTVWIWPDLSPSMDFKSHLSQRTKLDRVLVLAFALTDLLVRSGERVGLLGGLPPMQNRNAVNIFAETVGQMLADNQLHESIPPKAKVQPFSECVLLSDFLDPAETLIESMEEFASQGVRGHLIQILDPAEESLPYNGRVEFEDYEQGGKFISERAEDLREKYTDKLEAHRRSIKSAVRRLEWSFLLHHTDRPAEEVLLAVHAKLSGEENNYRFAPAANKKSRQTKQHRTEDETSGPVSQKTKNEGRL